MSENESENQEFEIDYYFWFLHEALTIEELILLFSGFEPSKMNLFKLGAQSMFIRHPIGSLIRDGVRSKQLKMTASYCISPIACYYFLSKKGVSLPSALEKVIESDLDEINEKLKVRTKKRTRESYQRKEVRGDEKALEAVLRTVLDLDSTIPKDTLIRLKPVQEYANGKNHSDQSLKEMISAIEGGNRKPGNVPKKNKEMIKRQIPDSWINYELEED